jgi:hypothetical protein
MVFNLRPNKASLREHPKPFNFGGHDGNKEAIPTARAMEERRAVLGCFVLSSMYEFSLVSDPYLIALAFLDTMQR